MKNAELATTYNNQGRVYWHCICPSCGQREAVLFGEGPSRACRFCGAKWNEAITLVRFLDMCSSHPIGESQITDVCHMKWPFAKAEYHGPEIEEEDILPIGDGLGVFMKDGQVWVSSRMVASAFEKEHRRVLQDVREIDFSKDFTEHHFVLSEYKDSTGRKLPEYLMDFSGFTALCMGYTGKKAAQYKEAYINRFNEMEAELRAQEAPALPSPKAAAGKMGKTPRAAKSAEAGEESAPESAPKMV